MKHFRISVDIDITARNVEQARRRASCSYSDIEHRPWVIEVLPNGIVERLPLSPKPRTRND